MIKKRTPIEREVDRELISRGRDVSRDFDDSQALHVSSKGWATQLISIRLPKWMILRLRELALQKGDMGYQRLIKFYLAEALSRPVGPHELHDVQQKSILGDIDSSSLSDSKEFEALEGQFKLSTFVDTGEFNQTRR